MRHLLPLLLLLFLCVLPAPLYAGSLEAQVAAIPDPHAAGSGWVHDPGGTLGPRLAETNAVIDDLERETGAEIGVAVLPTIGEEVPGVLDALVEGEARGGLAEGLVAALGRIGGLLREHFPAEDTAGNELPDEVAGA